MNPPPPVSLLSVVLPGDRPDRRRRRRLRLAYPLRLRRDGEADPIDTKTEDVSCEGFYCISNRDVALHENLECELVIPGDNPGLMERDIVLRCRAEVTRVVPLDHRATFGVGCRLVNFTIEQSIGGAEDHASATDKFLGRSLADKNFAELLP